MSSITELLCLLGSIHTTPGVSGSQQQGFSRPQDKVPRNEWKRKTGQKKKKKKSLIETMKSLFIHLSEPFSQCTPHSSAFFVLHTQTWLVQQTMSGELGWGSLLPPPPSSKPKPQMGKEPKLIRHTYIFSLRVFSFNSEGWRCSGLLLLRGKHQMQ